MSLGVIKNTESQKFKPEKMTAYTNKKTKNVSINLQTKDIYLIQKTCQSEDIQHRQWQGDG